MAWNLPTLAEMNEKPRACPKGPTRLELKMAAEPDDKKAGETFRAKVRHRDEMECRHCHKDVVRTMNTQPNQAHVHHIYGRLGVFRYADEHALLLCRKCHERVTGAVNAKLFILQLAADMLKVGEKWLIDARKPVQFKEAA